MIQQLLLAAQILVVGLVYFFVWRVMRTAGRDLLAPNSGSRAVHGGRGAAAQAIDDSTIIPAADAMAARRAAGLGDPRIVVVESSQLRAGVPFVIGSGLTFGRGAENDIVLDDAFVSGSHAKLVPPGTLVDLDSTNGTKVNGRPLRGRIVLRPGDQFQFGATVFRYEVPQ